MGCCNGQEHPVLTRHLGTHSAEILQQCVSRVLRKWQGHGPFCFSADVQLRVLPVNVAKSKMSNVARTQREAGEKKKDRLIANSDRTT